MSKAPFRIALLSAEHDRSAFNSGSKPLDSYLRQQVTQDSRRRITACFVALDTEGRIAGYYTLASASMLFSELPTEIGKKLPRCWRSFKSDPGFSFKSDPRFMRVV